MLGRESAALDLLQKSIEIGGIGYKQLAHDEDLENLHDNPRFQELMGKLETEMHEQEAEEHEYREQYRKQETKTQMQQKEQAERAARADAS